MIGLEVFCGACATILCLLVLVYVWKFKWSQRRVLEVASQLPSPWTLPLLGNAHIFFGSIEKVTTALNKLSRTFLGILCLWIGPIPIFVVSSPDDLKIILNSPKTLEKDDIYEFVKPFFGNGLITCPVSKWKRNRRALNPVFSSININSFYPSVNEASKKLTKKLKGFVGKGDVNFYDDIVIYFAESVCRTVLEIKEDIIDSSTFHSYFTDLLQRVARLLIYRFTKVWLAIDFMFNFFYGKDVKEINALFDQLVYEINQDLGSGKRTMRKEVKTNLYDLNFGNPSNSKEEELVTKNFRNILMDLIESDPTFTKEDVKFEIVTTLAAAVDTSSVTVGFCLLTLANLQEVQNTLYKEIEQVFGDSDRDVAPEDLSAMPYLDCVIKESLRRYRIVPFIGRKVTEDIKLSTCTIPAGGRIIININGAHMDPAVYPNPERFDPERFSPENRVKRHPYCFLPFSSGPRNCIGKNYSLMTMKIIIINILRKYELYTDTKLESIVYKIELVMGSKYGYPIRFECRSQNSVK